MEKTKICYNKFIKADSELQSMCLKKNMSEKKSQPKPNTQATSDWIHQ